MARLIRTEKEVEGRYEEVWTVVEEDALDQWPAGPLDVVGRPAVRQDGLQRARGEARYTADVALPGMLHCAVLRSPHGERPRSLDLGPALELPGVHAARLVPRGRLPQGGGRLPRRRPRRRGRRHVRAGAGCRGGDRRRLGAVRAAARPRRGGRARAAARGAEPLRAWRPRRRARDGGRGRRGRVPHRVRAPQRLRDALRRLRVEGGHTRGAHLDAVHLGCPLRARDRVRDPARPRPRDLRVHGRRVRRQERRRRLRARRGRAGTALRPPRAVRPQPP